MEDKEIENERRRNKRIYQQAFGSRKNDRESNKISRTLFKKQIMYIK